MAATGAYAGPQAALAVGGAQLVVVGSIPGFTPDAERVAAAWDGLGPTDLALGVPVEDLEGLRLLRDARVAGTDPPEMPDADPHTQRLFEMLAKWGTCRVPSPELELAFDRASQAGIPVHALDLGDQEHADRFTATVKMRHVVRSNAVHARMLKKPFPEQPDPYTLAQAWDDELNRTKPIAALEREREAHMARRLRELARPGTRILAVVPAPRFAGVVAAVRGASS